LQTVIYAEVRLNEKVVGVTEKNTEKYWLLCALLKVVRYISIVKPT
jgi:hypothetical protein